MPSTAGDTSSDSPKQGHASSAEVVARLIERPRPNKLPGGVLPVRTPSRREMSGAKGRSRKAADRDDAPGPSLRLDMRNQKEVVHEEFKFVE